MKGVTWKSKLFINRLLKSCLLNGLNSFQLTKRATSGKEMVPEEDGSFELQSKPFWARYLHCNTKVDHGDTGISVPADVHRSVATVRSLTFKWGAGCIEIVFRFLVYSGLLRGFYEMQGKSLFFSPLVYGAWNHKQKIVSDMGKSPKWLKKPY